jgi:3-oxoadipate enol-lactonase
VAGPGQARARALRVRLGAAGLDAARRLVRLPPVPAIPDGRTVELPGGARTYLVDTGVPATGEGAAAPTVVLLHALACTGLLTWYPSLDALRRRYRLVIFDQRWHGQASRATPFALDDCADDVAAVADLLDLDQVLLAGYSMGSLVAQLAALRHRDRIAGLVLCASTTHFADTPRRAWAVERAGARLTARAVAQRAAAVAALDQTLDDRWAWRQFRATTGADVAAASAAIAGFDSRPWVGRLDVPAAVVVTTRDRLVPPARQRALARALPDVTVYEADAGHACCVLGADRFTPALSAALASVSSRIAAPR